MTDIATVLQGMVGGGFAPVQAGDAPPICANCHTPTQCEIRLLGRACWVPCLCECESKKLETEKQQRKEQERMQAIGRLKVQGIHDRLLASCTFDKDDGRSPEVMAKAKRYVDKWHDVYSRNIGLLLWGDVGAGKTFAAACIANALLEQGIPVLVTNFTRLTNALCGFAIEDKNEYLNDFNRYKLLIIDDLGVERQSDYTLEQVYNVVDTRYKNRQPIIITTNLTLDEVKNPKMVQHRRIYSRVVEMCAPLCVAGENRRVQLSADKRKEVREILNW